MASIDIHASKTERHVKVNMTSYDDFATLSFRVGSDAVTFYLTDDQLEGIISQIGGE